MWWILDSESGTLGSVMGLLLFTSHATLEAGVRSVGFLKGVQEDRASRPDHAHPGVGRTAQRRDEHLLGYPYSDLICAGKGLIVRGSESCVFSQPAMPVQKKRSVSRVNTLTGPTRDHGARVPVHRADKR